MALICINLPQITNITCWWRLDHDGGRRGLSQFFISSRRFCSICIHAGQFVLYSCFCSFRKWFAYGVSSKPSWGSSLTIFSRAWRCIIIWFLMINIFFRSWNVFRIFGGAATSGRITFQFLSSFMHRSLKSTRPFSKFCFCTFINFINRLFRASTSSFCFITNRIVMKKNFCKEKLAMFSNRSI